MWRASEWVGGGRRVGGYLRGEQQVFFFFPFSFSLLIHIADSSGWRYGSLSQTGSSHRRSEYKRPQVTVGHLYSLSGTPALTEEDLMSATWAGGSKKRKKHTVVSNQRGSQRDKNYVNYANNSPDCLLPPGIFTSAGQFSNELVQIPQSENPN